MRYNGVSTKGASSPGGTSARRSTLRAHTRQRRALSRRSEAAVAPIEPPDETLLQRQAELEQELQLARDIQQGILLATVPSLPGWELSAVSNPARDLGGDLYDFLALPDGQHGIMIGDVSGKGLPAALRMAVARTVFRHAARQGNGPAHTLAAVNTGVCSDIPHGMVTMLYLLLDPLGGRVGMANAGHTYPFHIGNEVTEWSLSGLPLGIDTEGDYEEETLILEPGHSLVLYTDGVTEATDRAEELFGEERLLTLLAATRHLKPRALMRHILRELRAWNANGTPDDDITIVVLRRRFAHLADELHSIAVDVLGLERAALFWAEHITAQLDRLRTAADWAEFLPSLSDAARAAFGRGLAREFQQQLRLVVEEYR